MNYAAAAVYMAYVTFFGEQSAFGTGDVQLYQPAFKSAFVRETASSGTEVVLACGLYRRRPPAVRIGFGEMLPV